MALGAQLLLAGLQRCFEDLFSFSQFFILKHFEKSENPGHYRVHRKKIFFSLFYTTRERKDLQGPEYFLTTRRYGAAMVQISGLELAWL